MSDFIDKSEIIHELDNYEKGKGSWVYSEINGVKIKVYTKYLTGTTNAASPTLLAHGFADIDKVLPIGVKIYNNGVVYAIMDFYNNSAAAQHLVVVWLGAVNIELHYGAQYNSQKYQLKIDYYE